MGRKLLAGNFAPTAMIREKGAELTGIMHSVRTVKTQFGDKPVFSLKVVDAKCDFQKNKVAYEPEAGEVVEILAPNALASQLNQAKIGETVTIKYLGLGKKTKGNAPHLFDVEVA